jgi:hypothetical protein
VLVTVAVGMVTLILVAGLVLDLGAMRSDRRNSRLVVDAASAAGAAELATGSGVAACESALAYAEINLGVTFSGADCSVFPTSCGAGTPAAATTDTQGDWTLTITYPVESSSPLMDPAAIGASTQTVTGADGGKCERIGVELAGTHSYTFGAITGANSGSTSVHAVARGIIENVNETALNLVILERFECDAISASGSGGGQGGILTDAVLNTDTGLLDPGFITVDSDASSGCSTDGVINVDGSDAFVRADGPTGCPGETGTHAGPGGLTVGEGCGFIQTLAAGPPGCNMPACSSSGTVAPDPQQMSQRVTRAPIDHRYNCKASYPMPAGWGIAGCSDPPDTNIDDLVMAYDTGVPATFQLWSALQPAEGCSVEGGPTDRVVAVSGDVIVDCPGGFEVKRTVMFSGGDVIFTGPVTVTSDYGVLAVNSDGVSPSSSGSDNAVAYFRSGVFSKAGTAAIYLHRTAVYLAGTTALDIRGGTGPTSALEWTAPLSGDFEDLAMWSESATLHSLAGQNDFVLEGVFFAPWATIEYVGTGVQEQVDAQFISSKLHVRGEGFLVVRPDYERAVLFPRVALIQLIR